MMRRFKTGLKKILAASAFCFVLSTGIVAMADEGVVKVASAKIRASADTGSEQLGSVAQGGKVDIVSETTGTDGKKWYQVFVNANVKGYIRADLIEKSGGGSTTSANTATDTSETQATPVDAKKATVAKNTVSIRKGASTNHGKVATANRGMVVTVTGETTGSDGAKWYQVSFTYDNKEITGFIRSDLVTFDNVPADTVVSEITGTEENPQAPTEQQTEVSDEASQEQESNKNESVDIILMNVDEVPYVMPGFKPVTLNWNEQQINAYMNGKFYIFYAQKQSGEQGWFVFDSENNVYQRYPYSVEGVEIPEEKKLASNIPIIALGIVVVILLAIIALMFIKMREGGHAYDEFDNDDDDEDDDIEDLEELGDALEEQELERIPSPQPVRRPMNRPAPQPGASGYQQRRDMMQQPNNQPVRRPMDRPSQPVRRPEMSGQPVRRPQVPMDGDGVVRRRPAGMDGPQGRPQPSPRGMNGQPSYRPNPNPAQQRPQGAPMQQGHKAKNFLETDDDINFIDIE